MISELFSYISLILRRPKCKTLSGSEQMVRRATIEDLAQAAGVSVAMIDRVLNGRASVRAATAEKVLAAPEIGFCATPALEERLGVERWTRRLGVLLQQSNRILDRMIP